MLNLRALDATLSALEENLALALALTLTLALALTLAIALTLTLNPNPNQENLLGYALWCYEVSSRDWYVREL